MQRPQLGVFVLVLLILRDESFAEVVLVLLLVVVVRVFGSLGFFLSRFSSEVDVLLSFGFLNVMSPRRSYLRLLP